jgi:hypothetical protein
MPGGLAEKGDNDLSSGLNDLTLSWKDTDEDEDALFEELFDKGKTK